MNTEQITKNIENFVSKFNEMCKKDRRDFLIRERTVTYESGTQIKTYNVTYEVKKSRNSWSISAVTKGFWIFKKRFPLFTIVVSQSKLSFKGLYVKDSMLKFEEQVLVEKLDEYITICRKLPKDAFTRS